MKERSQKMYEMSDGRLEELACLRMADQAVELATTKINAVETGITSLRNSLAENQWEGFDRELAALELKRNRSRAGLVGRLRHEGIITSEMISATGRVNISETNGDSRMQYVEGYQYSPRTIKRWEKARTIPAVVAEVQQDKAPDGLAQSVYETAKNDLVSSTVAEAGRLTRSQRSLLMIKGIFRDEIRYPVSDAFEKVGRWFRGEREDGTRIHRRSLLKRVKGYFEPSLGSFGRVLFPNFMERQEIKRLLGSSQQASPLITTDEGKVNPNPTLIPSFSTKGGQVGQG